MSRLGTRVMTFAILVGMLASIGGCDQSNPVVSASTVQVQPIAQNVQPNQVSHPQPQPQPQPAPTQGRPQRPSLGPAPVEMNPREIDLGTVRPGTRTTGRTVITNRGTLPLRVLDYKASCTCTGATMSSRLIAPGEGATLEVVYSSMSAMGSKKNSVRVLFDGYDILEIPVLAFVALPVRADPPYINALPDEKDNPTLQGEYTVTSEDQRPFRILAVSGGPVPFVDFDPVHDTPRNTYKLKWDFSSYDQRTCVNAKGEPLPMFVTVETDHPDCALFDLQVRHFCTAPPRPGPNEIWTWAIQDSRLLLGAVKPDQPIDAELTVKFLSNHAHDDIVKLAATESKQFKVELLGVNTTPDAMFCKLRITPAADFKGLIYGPLRLYSERQDSAVTVIGVVRE